MVYPDHWRGMNMRPIGWQPSTLPYNSLACIDAADKIKEGLPCSLTKQKSSNPEQAHKTRFDRPEQTETERTFSLSGEIKN